MRLFLKILTRTLCIKTGNKNAINKTLSYHLNQRGVGLVPLMIAAALVAMVAAGIATFLSSQSKISQRVEVSGSCENIANSVVAYLMADDNSLFITSYGPVPHAVLGAAYPTGIYTKDGLDQFLGGIVPQYPVDAAALKNIPPTEVDTPAGLKFMNSLNIRNTMNRLVAHSFSQAGACCADLNNMNNNTAALSTCGSTFYDTTGVSNPPSLIINEGNVKVLLGVNFSNHTTENFCPTGILDIPVSSENARANFRVQVFVNPGMPNEKICSSQGTVNFASDTAAPLAITELTSGTACTPGQSGNPFVCDDSNEVTFRAWTVENTQACRTCLMNQISNTCQSGGANMRPGARCAAVCRDMDPGSLFLCRIGEKHWVQSNPNHWEPCHQTQVYGCAGGNWLRNGTGTCLPDASGNWLDLGNVRIAYDANSDVNHAKQTATGTRATITISGLTDSRAYQVDVRAVDTKGIRIGPSFASVATTYNISPSFIVVEEQPSLSGLDEVTTSVDLAGRMTGGQTIDPPAAAVPLSGQYQCQEGLLGFSGNVEYPSLPAYVYRDLDVETCTMSIEGPGGLGNLSPSCSCGGGSCHSNGINSRFGGNWNATMTVSGPCAGHTGGSANFNWCFESQTATMGGGINVGATNTASPTVGITSSGRDCGISVGMGSIAGYDSVPAPPGDPTVAYALNGRSGGIPGWNPIQHSGCLERPNIASRFTDVCGRSNTKIASYSSYLAISDLINITRNECGASSVQHLGNQCASGHCRPTAPSSGEYKCYSSHPLEGVACSVEAIPGNIGTVQFPCRDNRYCWQTTDGQSECSTQYQCEAIYNGNTYVQSASASDVVNGGGLGVPNSCDVNNSCALYNRNRCVDGSGNIIDDSSSCTLSPNSCSSGTCRVVRNCEVTGENCNPLGEGPPNCPVLKGEYKIVGGSIGTCQAPSNLSCDIAPGSCTKQYCPPILGGVPYDAAIWGATTYTEAGACGATPPVCTTLATETGECVSGSRSVTYITDPPGCRASTTESCTVPATKWCFSGVVFACQNVAPPNGHGNPCNLGDTYVIDMCSGGPRGSTQSHRYTCVDQSAPCPSPPPMECMNCSFYGESCNPAGSGCICDFGGSTYIDYNCP